MPRIHSTPTAVPTSTNRAAQPAPTPRRNSVPSAGNDSFVDPISPRPLSAESYTANFASHFNYGGVRYAPDVGGTGLTTPRIAEAGKPLFIDYGRLPENIGLPGTLTKVEVFYKIDGGPVQSATLAEGAHATAPGLRSPYKIDIPQNAKGEVEYWFKLHTAEGHEHYDSNFGQNFRTNIIPAGGATLRFDDLWGEALSAPIRAGSTLRLAYDVDRIKPLLRGTSHHGAATWGAVAWVSFDGKPPQEVPLTAPRTANYGMHVAIEPVEGLVEIPHDAKSVSIWIQGRAYANTAFDSDFGKNYTFPIEPANG